MAVTVETLEKLERRITLTLAADTISSEVESRLKRLSRTVKAAGFRPGKVPMSVVTQRYGYSVQYAGDTSSTWSKTDLTNVALAPGAYYLVQEAAGSGSAPGLPTPDATGTIAMATSAGKVVLVNNTTLLSGTCPASSSIIDFAGYGSSASCFEGAGRAPAPSNTTADFRKAGGCVDPNDNAADFFTSAPFPRNSSSPLNNCAGGATPNLSINDVTVIEGNSGTITATFTVTLSAPAQGTDATLAAAGIAPQPPLTAIM